MKETTLIKKLHEELGALNTAKITLSVMTQNNPSELLTHEDISELEAAVGDIGNATARLHSVIDEIESTL